MAWWRKFFKHPQEVFAQSVYALESRHVGKPIFVVAPGPSLDDFPKNELERFTTIAVNAAAEIISPTYFLAQEGLIIKKYYRLYTTDRIKRIVTSRARQFIERVLPKGHELYCYNFLCQTVLNSKKDGPMYWRDPEKEFLPGRNSISSNAISLAILMGAPLIVLVGVDFHMGRESDKYYANGVKINQGPRLRAKALGAGYSWAYLAARRGVWQGPRILTTSPWLHLRGIQNVSPEQALKEADIAEQATT